MRPHPDRLHRLAAIPALAALALTVGGCASDDDPAGSADAGTSASASSTPSPANEGGAAPSTTGSPAAGSSDAPTSAADGTTGSASEGSHPDAGLSPGASTQGPGDEGVSGQPAADPNSPFVVAASAVAQRSRDQVTQLHAMGVGTTGAGQLPQDQIPQLATSIRTELTAQIADCTMLPPPDGSPAAALAAALADYRSLADDLSGWEPGGRPMGAAWFSRLQRVDRDWKAALRRLGGLSQQDLLAGLAPLLMPAESR